MNIENIKDFIIFTASILIIEILCVKNGISSYKQMKFYEENAEETEGKVVLWNERSSKDGTYYELEVEANDKTYKITTSNPKAKKYKNKMNIIIFAPKEFQIPESVRNKLQKDASEKFEQFEKLDAELKRTKLTIIKEDMRGIKNIRFSVIFGTLFLVIYITVIIGAAISGF